MKKRNYFSSLLALVVFAVFSNSMCNAATNYYLVTIDDVVTKVLAGENGEKLFESADSKKAIEWSLANSQITIVSEGTYSLSAHINIPRENISLIITEKAVLITEKNAKVIKVSEGHGGSNGINGGLIFSCGKFLTSGDASWIVDSENVNVPLLWSRTTSNILAIEGGDFICIGTVAELNNVGRPEGQDRHGNEAIDLNSYCRNLYCELAIGTAPLEETVDINNSTDCIFEEVRAYGKCNRLVKFTTYKSHQRRLTQKSYIENSEGTVINKEGDFRDYVLKSWKTDFKVEDLLENLPTVKVTAKLTGEFENHAAEEVLNKTYTLDLTPR